MIYKINLIDENGISLLEKNFKDLNNVKEDIITNFFNGINQILNDIQKAKTEGRNLNEKIKVLESNEYSIVIFYHWQSKLLFCSISDIDDDIERIKRTVIKIGWRFFKKHQSDIETFRTTTEKNRFQTFYVDIENFTLGGRIAEVYPKLLIIRSIIEKIFSTGLITEFDLQVALSCDGKKSPLKIARFYNKSSTEINSVLNKLEQLDIIKF